MNERFFQIVVVPDVKTAKKVPAVPGLLEYRKDTKELYVRANESWSIVAQQEKVDKVSNKEIMSSNFVTSCRS